jgi:hypothetical protein
LWASTIHFLSFEILYIGENQCLFYEGGWGELLIYLRIPLISSEAGSKFYIEKEGKRSSSLIDKIPRS